MTNFPNQMGQLKPWFGKRYHFEPKQDITAFELSQILIFIGEQTPDSSVAGWKDFPNGIPAPLDRHFRMLEY
ncbi:hypothetical protein [Methylobacterium sp. CM6246]